MLQSQAWWDEVKTQLEWVLPVVDCPKPDFELVNDENFQALHIANAGYGISLEAGGPIWLQRAVYHPGGWEEPPSSDTVDLEELSIYAKPSEVVTALATLIAKDRIEAALDRLADDRMAASFAEEERLVEQARRSGAI